MYDEKLAGESTMTNQEIKEVCTWKPGVYRKGTSCYDQPGDEEMTSSIEQTKAERIQLLESRVAELKERLNAAEWELELLKGSGPLLDQLFAEIDASDKTYNEVIEFLKGERNQ